MDNTHDVIIVGAGLSGLSVAHFLDKLQPHMDILLLEGGKRAGGAIRSCREQGYLAEWGPHGFLDNNAASREILADLGLDHVAQKAPLGDFRRYLCHRGKLVALPQSPKALLTTPLLNVAGKLRLLGDLFIPPRREDQTVGQWAAHRFGPQVLPMVDAAVTGTFAGDYARLSIDAVMPGVRDLEKEAGSVLRGMIKNRKKAGGGKQRLPAMTSFPNGMEQLVTTMIRGRTINYNTTVTAIARQEKGWRVETSAGPHRAPTLILALPVNRALTLLGQFNPPVTAIPEAKIATVAMGFSRKAQVPYGFGYLAPEREKRFALGAMFSTHMFPGRAPEGRILIEALVGGRRHPDRLELDDRELIEKVHADLGEIMALPEPPVFSRVLRSAGGIPQLEMGHPRLLAWRQELAPKTPGLFLCGFGWQGIGMNDMMQAAQKVAHDVVNGMKTGEKAALKPVYF